MLTPEEVVEVVRDLHKRHRDELPTHDRVDGYLRGVYGRPSVPESAGDELDDLARMSIKNVLTLVRDAFAQNLSVVGFRSPNEQENGEVWQRWQAQRMDARQAEVHRAAVAYGSAYTVRTSAGVRIRTPRQIIAVYVDPHTDPWPVYSLETWVDDSGREKVWKGTLLDSTHEYPVTLGRVPRYRGSGDDPERDFRRRQAVNVVYDEDEAREHGATYAGEPVCPVIRFVNARDAERLLVGEIEPLIEQQRAINAVNFDRLCVSRFGAFPQKYVIGWLGSDAEAAKASVSKLMRFEDGPDDVKVGAFPSADTKSYNEILREMLLHVALTAQVTPMAITGDVENIADGAAAMIDAPHQRKLAAKRESFGESWEQDIRLDAEMAGIGVSEDAEVVWRNTESRAFGAVVDGIQKLSTAGVPIESLLDDVPGWTQQQVESAKAAVRRGAGRATLDALRLAAGGDGG